MFKNKGSIRLASRLSGDPNSSGLSSGAKVGIGVGVAVGVVLIAIIIGLLILVTQLRRRALQRKRAAAEKSKPELDGSADLPRVHNHSELPAHDSVILAKSDGQ